MTQSVKTRNRLKVDPPMRVLVASLFHPDIVRGGAQRVAHDLFKGYSDRGMNSYFLGTVTEEVAPALYKSGAWITGFNGRPNEFILLQRGYDYFWHRSRNASAIERVGEFLKKIDPDIVHLHHFFTFGMELIPLVRRIKPDVVLALTLHEFLSICFADGQMRKKDSKKLCRKATPWECHRCFPDIGPELFFQKDIYFKDIFRDVDVFVAPTNFVKERYMEWGLPAAKIAVISNPDTEKRKRIPLPSRAVGRERAAAPILSFGFLGQLVDNKGVDILIGASQLLVDRNIRNFSVNVFGGNEKYATEEMRAVISGACENPELKGIIEFKGEYGADELEYIMAGLDVVIVPSTWWEIFCLVVTEAWRFGRPVICSDIGGLGERVVDGRGGLKFRVGDHVELAGLMEQLIDHPDHVDGLIESIPEVPGIDAVVSAHLELFATSKK